MSRSPSTSEPKASFGRHATLLFLALRAGDLVALAAGLWFVPKFVAPEELGAVLPVTTFATLLALPVFAFAMAVMKESADLAQRGLRGELASLWRGVFLGVAILAVVSIGLSVALLPRYLARLHVSDAAAAAFALAAAMLGCVAPVYTDALQAVKRFRALAAVEFASACARFATLLVVMPLRAFAGYFLGNAMQPLVRIAASVFALRHDLAVRSASWWTLPRVKTLAVRFALILVYLAIPMAVADFEQDIIRTDLPATESAAYYIVTRLSDILNYLTWPLLIVLFPYAAEAQGHGRSTRPLVLRCAFVTLVASCALELVYAFWGPAILALIPNGANYTDYLHLVPTLLAITAFTACQTFYTNAEVAAGRFGFLLWFIPVNILYALLLHLVPHASLDALLDWFLVGATLRLVCAAIATHRTRVASRTKPTF